MYSYIKHVIVVANAIIENYEAVVKSESKDRQNQNGNEGKGTCICSDTIIICYEDKYDNHLMRIFND